MTRQNDFLERMRIASPCEVGWDHMTGDDQARFCNQCNLHVYNISEMTEPQVKSLVASTEGRICARLYRRADGTVLTKDCPVGLRALKRRVARIAGAALTMLLSVSSIITVVGGQTRSKKDKICSRETLLKIKRTPTKGEQVNFTGIVLDPNGAVIPAANITLINEQTKDKLSATTTSEGEFGFTALAPGSYNLEVKAANFNSYKLTNLLINPNEATRVDVTLQVNGETVTVGILVESPGIESSNGTTVFSGEMIRRLPIPE